MMFDLYTEKCVLCGKEMIREDKNNVFSLGCINNQEKQMKEKNVVFISKTVTDGYYHICVECEKAGKASFVCQICGLRHPTSEIQESFGDPPEYLCKNCYATTTAKKWCQKVDELEESHRWDYE